MISLTKALTGIKHQFQMTTKDQCFLSFKDKQNLSDSSNGRYANLNLNQNHQCLDVGIVHSINFSNKNKIAQNYDLTQKTQKNKSSILWKKSKNIPSEFSNIYSVSEKRNESKEKEKGKDLSSKNKNSSTLSLHIAAYANSVEAAAASDSFEKIKDKSCLDKNLKNVKNLSTDINNSYEFPRQQSDDKSNPAVMQFSASQQLFNPNQENCKSVFANRAMGSSVLTANPQIRGLQERTSFLSMMEETKLSPQYALIASQTTDPYSTRLIHPQTGVSVWSFKGSEYQNGSPSLFEPVGLEGDFFLAAINGQPLLHFIGFNSKKRFHVKSLVAGKVTAACTDPSGCFIFAAIEEKIYVWSVATRELLNVFNAHVLEITALKISEDGIFLVSGSADGSVAVFHIRSVVGLKIPGSENVEAYHNYNPHTTAISDIFITPGQQPRILSVSDQTAVLFSLPSKKQVFKVTVDYPISSCTMDAGEFRMYLGLNNGTIAFINLNTQPFQIDEIFDASRKNTVYQKLSDKHKVAVCKLGVSYDGTMLVSGDVAGKYFIWSLQGNVVLHEGSFNGPIIKAAFVRPWPSISDENYVTPPLNNVSFHKQLISNQMELTIVKEPDADTLLNKKIENLLHAYVTKAIAEYRSPPTSSTEDGIENIQPPTAAATLNTDEKDKRIQELEKELEEVQEANAELYKMCRDMIVEEDDTA